MTKCFLTAIIASCFTLNASSQSNPNPCPSQSPQINTGWEGLDNFVVGPDNAIQTFVAPATGYLGEIKVKKGCSQDVNTILGIKTQGLSGLGSGLFVGETAEGVDNNLFAAGADEWSERVIFEEPVPLIAGETYEITVLSGCIGFSTSNLYEGSLSHNAVLVNGNAAGTGGDLLMSMIVCEDATAADVVGCQESYLSCDYNPDAEYPVNCTYAGTPINTGFGWSNSNFISADEGGGQIFKVGQTGNLRAIHVANNCELGGGQYLAPQVTLREYVGDFNPFGGAVIATATGTNNQITGQDNYYGISATEEISFPSQPLLSGDSYYVLQLTQGCLKFKAQNQYDGHIVYSCTPSATCPGYGENNGTTGDLQMKLFMCPDEVTDFGFGCLDEAACNYDPSATLNAGCEYAECYGCTDPSACNYDADAIGDDGSCEGVVDCAGVCGGTGTLDCNGDCNGSAYTQCGICVEGNTGISAQSEEQNAVNGPIHNFVDDPVSVQQIIPETTGVLQYIKSRSAGSPNAGCIQLKDVLGNVLATYCEGSTSNAIKTNTSNNPAFVEAGSVYLLTVTSGSVYYTDQDLYPGNGVFAYDTGWYPYGGPYSTTGDLRITTFICPAVGGCTDETACNFDASAEANDYSCEYPDDDECDCDGSLLDAIGVCGGACTADDDADGICDDIDDCVGDFDDCSICNGDNSSCTGCMDANACDYDPAATIQLMEGSDMGALSFSWPSQGSWASEISWSFNGQTYGVGASPTVEVPAGTYTINGFDSYGDGWNGGVLAITDVASGQTTNFTFSSGSSASIQVNVTGNQTPACDYESCVDDCGVVGGDNSSCADCCGVPNGDGSSCEGACGPCGADIPEGDCDCDGNQLDAIGVCGGACAADADSDGICDDVDDCVGAYDDCGVCNGPGAIYECGCADIPEGDCDCDGNQLDALGVCGGSCTADADADSICDDVDDCVGAYDDCGVCNGPGAIYECGCANIPEGDCDCEGNRLDALGVCGGSCTADADADSICDDVDDCIGAYDDCGVCNGPGAIYECGCDPSSCTGCTDPLACNYSEAANVDDESCTYPETYYDCSGTCLLDTDGDGVCDELEVSGCTDSSSCTYDSSATDDDGSCQYLDNCGVCGGDNSCCPDLMTLSSTVSGCSGNDGTATASVSGCSASQNQALSILHQYMTMGPEMEYCIMASDPFMCEMWGMFWGVEMSNVMNAAGISYFEMMDALAVHSDNEALSILHQYMTMGPEMEYCIMASDPFMCEMWGMFWGVEMSNAMNAAGISYFEMMDALAAASSACTVSWSDEAGNDLGTAFELSGLAPGTYTAALTHTNGCTDVKTVEVGYSCAGCTDPLACNYSEAANVDDGTCIYAEGGVMGCTYPDACNYNELANVDDGNCDFGTCVVSGCTYEGADNYNAEATDDDGSCIYDEALDETFQNGYESGLSDAPECPPSDNSCPEDLDGDGEVATSDLLIFLSAFASAC